MPCVPIRDATSSPIRHVHGIVTIQYGIKFYSGPPPRALFHPFERLLLCPTHSSQLAKRFPLKKYTEEKFSQLSTKLKCRLQLADDVPNESNLNPVRNLKLARLSRSDEFFELLPRAVFLTRLDLDGCGALVLFFGGAHLVGLGDFGAQRLGAVMSSGEHGGGLRLLRTLDVKYNGITDAGMAFIGSGLRGCPMLSSLYIGMNSITDSGKAMMRNCVIRARRSVTIHDEGRKLWNELGVDADVDIWSVFGSLEARCDGDDTLPCLDVSNEGPVTLSMLELGAEGHELPAILSQNNGISSSLVIPSRRSAMLDAPHHLQLTDGTHVGDVTSGTLSTEPESVHLSLVCEVERLMQKPIPDDRFPLSFEPGNRIPLLNSDGSVDVDGFTLNGSNTCHRGSCNFARFNVQHRSAGAL